MKKLFFFLTLVVSVVFMTSCSKSRNNDAEIDATLTQLRADREYREKYEQISLPLSDCEATIYVKSGEKVQDIYVMTTESRNVDVLFSSGRRYMIFFTKGEQLKSWGKKEIVTNQRTVKLHWLYE